MTQRDDWMWPSAMEMLGRAQRLHQQFFHIMQAGERPVWEPPVDVFETAADVFILSVLPGVPADAIEVATDERSLVIAGTRRLPPALHTAAIHRLELPQGRFERRVALPPGVYEAARTAMLDGCLVVQLHKVEGRRR